MREARKPASYHTVNLGGVFKSQSNPKELEICGIRVLKCEDGKSDLILVGARGPEKPVGRLWKSDDPDSPRKYSGSFGKGRMAFFENAKRTKDTQPLFNAVLSEPKDEHGKRFVSESEEARRAANAEVKAEDFQDDDLPF